MIKRKSPEREQEILTATLRVLRKYGVSATSTVKIAAEAKCSKETLYNWFGNRDGLYAALINAQSSAYLEALGRAIAQGHTLHEKLEHYSGSLLDLLTGEANGLVIQLTLGQSNRNHQMIKTAMLDRHEMIMKPCVNLLVEEQAKGNVEFEEAVEVFSTLYGLVISDRQMASICGFDDARPSGGEMRIIARAAVDRLFLIYKLGEQE